MADTYSYTTKPQILSSQVKQNHPNPSKSYTHFLYKALIVTIFLLLVPLFPSQAPEFINQTLHTRSWELLQLVFVGIAVSYGLFSTRNYETEKEHTSKFDNAQSYVSRLLQVSSVFDDEAESPSAFDDNKVQTWSSQYYRNEPMVVVAEKSSVLEEQRDSTTLIGEKPLLLPVRSLKSRVSDADDIELTKPAQSSNSDPRRFSTNSMKLRNGGYDGTSPRDTEEKKAEGVNSDSRHVSRNLMKIRNGTNGDTNPRDLAEENVVFRSPIPWRSRSGRMVMKEDGDSPPHYDLPPSMEDSEFNQIRSHSFSSRTSLSSEPNSASPSPNKLSLSPSLSSPKTSSHLPSFSSELQAKNGEDLMRKKINQKSSSPPVPPPPPPPPSLRKSVYMKSNSSLKHDVLSSENELKRSTRSVPFGLNMRNREGKVVGRANSWSESKPRAQNDSMIMGKSVRTIKEHTPDVPQKNHSDFPKQAKRYFVEQVVVETDDDDESESEDDYFEGCEKSEKVASNSEEAESNGASDMGPDVDKKADEFIAKFREQIRLQRIDSIRKSTRQPARKTV